MATGFSSPTHPPRPRSGRRRLTAIAIAIVALGGLVAGCDSTTGSGLPDETTTTVAGDVAVDASAAKRVPTTTTDAATSAATTTAPPTSAPAVVAPSATAPPVTTAVPTTLPPAPTVPPVTVPPTTVRPPGSIWRPALVTPWQWMIDHALDPNNPKDMGLVDPNGAPLSTPPPQVYDIDWQFNSPATVAQLHAMGKKVICYVDVGVFETYRPDAKAFPDSVKGQADSHWEGSFWLDIRQTDVLLPIMRARFELCRAKGFDAIEPDEIDGYANSTGFPLTYADQLAYNRAIADLAHSMGLSVGLKGDIAQAKDLWPSFDWSLNEQCFEFSECSALSTYFVAKGKAVFQVEYDDPYSGHVADPATFCPQANAANFNSMKMPLNLNGGRWPCR